MINITGDQEYQRSRVHEIHYAQTSAVVLLLRYNSQVVNARAGVHEIHYAQTSAVVLLL